MLPLRYPGLSETAKTDLRAYAAAGNNVVFLGNYVAVQFMNDVFGFQLTDDYQNGPYYRCVSYHTTQATEKYILPQFLCCSCVSEPCLHGSYTCSWFDVFVSGGVSCLIYAAFGI
jgi:hypothetical protein